MLLVDSNEARNQPALLSALQEAIDVEVSSINQSAAGGLVFPDFVIYGANKLVGINRKTVGEWLGSMDACLEQLQRELQGPVEQLALIIEGVMRPTTHGTMLGYSVEWEKEHYFSAKGWGDLYGNVPFRQRSFSVNPKHAQNQQTRLEFMGVQVIHTYSTADTAAKLISLHDMILKGEPNRVLDRLIKTDITVLGLDADETNFARMLMSVPKAGWGEELALTVASLGFKTVGDLFRYWDGGSIVADTMLRGGTRRVGSAAERKLQTALGYSKLQSPEPAEEQGDTEYSLPSA